MKKLVILINLIFLFSFSMKAQGPPAPYIYSAPQKADIKKYVVKEDNFEIDFAGNVDTSSTNFSGGVENTYSKKAIGTLTKVTVTTTNQRLTENEIKLHLEKLKQEHLEPVENSLEYEKVIDGNQYTGIEFAYKRGYEYVKVHLFVVGRKTFELYIDVTNWHILNDHRKDKVKEFEDEATRFFNSYNYLPTTIKGTKDSPIFKSVGKNKAKVKTKTPAKPTTIGKDLFSRRTKTFNTPKGAFSAYFPFRPRKNVIKVESTEGYTDFVVHESTTRYYSYSVGYIDSPYVVDTEEEKSLNYQIQAEELATRLKGKIKNQDEIAKYGFKGRDYIITSKSLTLSVRMIFAKQRLFRLVVITRGKPNSRTGKLARSNQRIVDRFFNSFKVTELPTPKFGSVELPDDFGGSIEGNNYVSSYFGFSSRVPEGWSILDQPTAELIFKYGTEVALEDTKKYKELTKKSAENTKLLFLALKEETEEDEVLLIAVAAESLSTPIFLPKVVIEFNILTLEENEEVTIGLSKRIIDGINFAWYETKDNRDHTLTRLYVANLNKLALEIVLVYKTKEELEDLEKFLNSIKFKKSNE